MIRVLVLAPWFPNEPGDREGNFIYDSAAALSRNGVEVAVLVVRPWLRANFGQSRYRSLSRNFDPQKFSAFKAIELAHYVSVPGSRLPRVSACLHDHAVGRRLSWMARSFGATLIHAHTEGEAPMAMAVGRKLNVPVVVTIHGINTAPRYFGSAYRRRRIADGLAAADRIVFVGAPTEEYFARLFGRRKNFAVIPNGFSPPQRDPAPRRKSDGVLRLVSVTNLHEGKGIDTALQALADARARGLEEFAYTIVGDGAERESLVSLAERLGLNDKVRFAGACLHDRVYEYLSQADVFLLPSYREAFGVAYLEGMAAGLLAIGVAGQGPSAFIRDGETGILIPPHDSHGLADRLIDLASDREKMRAMAAAGQAYVMSNLTWDNHAQRLVAMYREIVASRAGAGRS